MIAVPTPVDKKQTQKDRSSTKSECIFEHKDGKKKEEKKKCFFFA